MLKIEEQPKIRFRSREGFSLASLLGLVVFVPAISFAEYSPRDFLSQAPAETFYTEDEMSEDDKRSVLGSTFDPNATFTCTSWGIADESPTSLTLKICQDSFVRIQLFRERSGGTIVAVESNRSSGRAVDLRFLKVTPPNKTIATLSEPQLATLGLTTITENELLSDNERLPSDIEERVPLGLDGNGRPAAIVQSWNAPRWTDRTVAFDLFFEWDGSRFQRRKVPMH